MKDRLLVLDRQWTTRLSLAKRSQLLRALAALLAHSGDSWFWIAGLALVWWLGNLGWRPRAAVMLIGILVTAVLVMTIKLLVRRARPEGEWGSIYRRTDPHSFPSGHAARALMLAVLAVFLGPSWFAVLMILWAPLVSLARVSMGVHYLSDVAAGVVLGLVVGLVIGLLVTASAAPL
jgi:undecaprenyl-diphosphatase